MISLEKYDIVKEIGRGGMGLVYLANDLKLDRTVAIKELIISPTIIGRDKEDIVARFKREAQTAAKLSHPNIITIYDVGEEQDRHYIAMEYLPGKTLKDYLDEKFQFSLEEAIDIILQISSGLDHAHSKSIIHRDIKPENIKVLENNVIKLMDFGIASIENSKSGLTQDGTLLGTIAYISPEQLYNSKNVDTRADIFSLGALIYEMFTGRLPFDGDTIGSTIVKIMSETPKPPKQINPNIKSDLEDIILKCLEKDPDKRYQKVREVAQDLLYYKMSLSNKELYQLVSTEESTRSLSSETVSITRPRMTIPGLTSLRKRKFSILHIEDDRTIKEVFSRSIQKNGFPYEYNFVTTIEEAKKVLQSEIFDIVLCDYNLPDGNFFSVFDDISHLPIVVTTSIADPELIIEVMKKGVKEYVIKDPELKYIDKIYSIIEKNISKEEQENGVVIPQRVIKNYDISFIKTIGNAGSDQLQFSSPRWIHISSDEKLLIADTKNSRIQILDKQGNFLSMFMEESMLAPCGVATDNAGKIYTVDALDCKVRVFSPEGNLLNTFGGKGNAPGQFSSVYGIIIYRNEKIYITDPDGHKISIFDLEGNITGTFSANNTDHGEYKTPSGIAADKNFIYILDHSLPKIKVINNFGVPEIVFGKRGTGKGDFSVPKGIGVDAQGRIYITETLSHRVQVFSPKGDWVYTFGSKGTDNGQFNGAESIAIANDGTIFVLDRGNNRIQVFSYPV